MNQINGIQSFRLVRLLLSRMNDAESGHHFPVQRLVEGFFTVEQIEDWRQETVI